MHIMKHLHTINKHRILVMKYCFKSKLYWRGLVHDLSKYSFIEFFEGSKYYVGDKSPIQVCREKTGISKAWLHHKGRNCHHYEYWTDKDSYLMMPYNYAVESICDRIAATKVYYGKKYNNSLPYEYLKREEKKLKGNCNNNLFRFYDLVLIDLKKYGERYILNEKYLQKQYKKALEI